MLPHIDSKNGRPLRNRILILRRHNLQPLLARTLHLHQPAPSTPLQRQQHTRKHLPKRCHRSPLRLDSLLQLRRDLLDLRLRGPVGGQVLPEQRVVDVSAAVEPNLLLQGNELGDVAGGLGFFERGQGAVQVSDVRLVVLLVVDLHDLRGDGGFKGLLGVLVWGYIIYM